jgi:hypothetical protein
MADTKTNPSAKTVQVISATSLNYRPRDYFGRHDLQTTLLTQVKGRVRRKFLLEALEDGQISDVPQAIRDAALSDDARRYVGAMHPAFMGGEYLPTASVGELEIARISIDSTTSDVTSVLARVVGNRIAYRVVDEYQGDTLSGKSRRTSMKPLTMGELIDFFLGAWDLYACLDCNFEGDVDGMLGFFSGESEFYPCFDAQLRELVRQKFPQQLDEEDDDHDDKGELASGGAMLR